jgi:glycosyltransferase 2 family protein
MKQTRAQTDRGAIAAVSGGGTNATETVTSTGSSERRGPRLFISTPDLPRARRATDVILLVTSFAGMVFVGRVAVPEPGFSRAVTTFLGALPAALTGVWQVLADSPTVWALVVLVAAFTRRHAKVGRDMILAILVGIVLWLLLGRMVTGAWPEMRALLGDVRPPPVFPSARLGIPTALLMTASPHLVRPARRLGYAIIALGSIAHVALGASSTVGVGAALLSAASAAAIVHLIVGSSAGRPSLDDVRFALADLNVAITELGAADRQDAGLFSVAARGADGSELIVKLYGRDAHDAALVSTVWRTIWLRHTSSPVGFGRLRQVEHEALMTLLAAQAGVASDAIVTAGATATHDAVLVLRRNGTPLVEPGRFDAGADAPAAVFTGVDARQRLEELWALLATLHDNGIARGELDTDHLIVAEDGRLGLVQFRGATVAPTPSQLHNDNAQLFITSIGLVGREPAIEGLVEHRSVEEIEALLPYLQPSALTADQRRMMNVLDIDLDALRAEVAQASGVEAPPLIQMRRFTLASVMRVAMPALAVVVLLSAIAGFDFEAFVDSLQGAAWWLVAIGFIVAQLPRLAQAVSTLGAAPVPLPLGPVYALQLAISYVNLAVPTAASRIAVNVRFFQRQGVPPATAMATGALDGLSGFIVQALLLGSLLLFTGLSLDVDMSGPASAALRIAWMLVVAIAVALLVILLVPRLRRVVVGAVRRTIREAVTVLRGLRSPRRLAMLFGGNLVSEVMFALALGVVVQAFGYSLGLHELLFINLAVSLLAGLVPVPGGVGVTEGGLIFGLTSFGVPQEVAFAAVMLYRLSTFYTPPIWGFFSLRWLERNRYL